MSQTPDGPTPGIPPSQRRQRQRTIDSVMPIVAFLVLLVLSGLAIILAPKLRSKAGP